MSKYCFLPFQPFSARDIGLRLPIVLPFVSNSLSAPVSDCQIIVWKKGNIEHDIRVRMLERPFSISKSSWTKSKTSRALMDRSRIKTMGNDWHKIGKYFGIRKSHVNSFSTSFFTNV
jgi:hypothetical protein